MVRRAALLPLVAAGLLGALLASGVQAETRRTVAILPLVVHALEEQDYLRAGLADMLASRLGRFEGVGVMRLEEPGAATTDLETARAAARQAGAEWVLFGSFTRFGDGASLDVRCVPVEGEAQEPRSVFIQSGALGEIIPRLDGLAEKIAHHVTSGGRAGVASGPGEPAAAAPGGAAALREELRRLRDRVERLEAVVPVDATAGGRSGSRSGQGADLARELR